ncbi:MAG TPA: hypothetical protein VNJ54_07130 [Plantibacter sp.]|uniref:hypothetical protein n=1 Tax=Plantibacter sp. TaxID=1871045 RepID=UPI002CEEE0C6|nr:hypothetical protein [Plantibacter sp.]
MSVLIEVDGEQFRVETRTDSDRRLSIDFTWLNGPAGGTYGFTVASGTREAAGTEETLTRAQIEHTAAGFVLAFFADGGIGASDFPEFVLSRRT